MFFFNKIKSQMSFFAGKVMIITGASSGIGLACVRYFAELGANVVMAARSIDKMEEIRESLPKKDNVLCVKTDVANEDECRNLIEKTVERFGGIDILVNNAGLSMRAMFKDLDLSVIHKLMDTNFWGTVNCTKYALPYLLERKGSVVGIISTAGYIGLPARTGYCASKFAIRGFLDTIRIEHLYDGLHVLVFAPGFTASNIRNTALTADGSPQGATPRKEEKMMTAEKVARKLARGLRRRTNQMVLTPMGKASQIVNFFFPRLVNRVDYDMMAAEPNSPLKPYQEKHNNI